MGGFKGFGGVATSVIMPLISPAKLNGIIRRDGDVCIRMAFAAHGCKVSDHALDVVLFAEANESELDSILARRLAGEALSEHEVAQFKTAVLVFLGAEYARRGWVQQYHIGALRNNNLRQFKLLGPDLF